MTALASGIDFVSFNDLVNWSVRYLRESRSRYKNTFSLIRIGDFLIRNRNIIEIQDDVLYTRVTIRLYTKGVLKRDEEWGRNIGTKRQFVVSPGQFILSKIDARNGAFGLVPPNLDGSVTTADFLSYDVDTSRINPEFLTLVSSTKEFLAICQSSSSGTTGRQRVDESQFLNIKIPLPSLAEQDRIVAAYNARITEAKRLEEQAKGLEEGIEEYLFEILGIGVPSTLSAIKGLQFTSFQTLSEWSVNRIIGQNSFASSIYSVVNFDQRQDLINNIFRGKSPVYESSKGAKIINQKCVRWNVIALEYAKDVKAEWLANVENEVLTKACDILINSTGDGTIGRAAIVTEKEIGLLYDSHVLCLRLKSESVDPRYFMYLFNSRYGQAQVDSIKSAQSTKQTELGIGNLMKIFFPLPELTLQKEIALNISAWHKSIKTYLRNAEKIRQQAIEEIESELFAS